MEYLGHVIYPGGLGMQQVKVEAIACIPRPTNVIRVCAFMGLANYYYKYVKGFSVMGRITRWLLLFPEYDFTIVDALSRLTNIIEPIGVSDQTTYASLFYTKREWLKDVKEFLRT